MTNQDPGTSGPAQRGWSAGTIAAVSVAIIVLLAAISYVINNPSQSTTARVSATTSGQGTARGPAPAASVDGSR